jgi:glycosyltransferase involved in cell wall biosynthesis
MSEPAPMRLLAVTRKPHSASFEQRIANYVQPLAERGIEVVCRDLPRSTRGQHRLLGEARPFDGVWWHRHPMELWWLGRLRRCCRRLVLDFDDPLFYSARHGGRPSFTRRRRFVGMLRRCDAALPASEYLAALARPHCREVIILPMAIDLPDDVPAPARDSSGPIECLWLGSRSTQPCLEEIGPALAEAGKTTSNLRLRLVGHYPLTFGSLPVDYRPWSPQEQDSALRECHIGLCPMPDTPWTRGKCPYKVLQYMAYGMPWVGTAIGENVIAAGGDGSEHGEAGPRGLCVESLDEWVAAIRSLADDPDRRRRMGEAGRAYVPRVHDRRTLADRLEDVWRRIAG